jgi:soluble lytic murein transglycosylase
MLGHSLASHAGLLHDPAFNLDLGQRYIVFLAAQEPVNGDLIRLLASYNAGLGSFARWAQQIRDQGDPLLFIEAIPIDETRTYVPRVLTYTWLYAARLHLPAPSLTELAAGLWPRYHPRETQRGDAAWPVSTKVAASLP